MASDEGITFTDYALLRMHQRDILEEEVREVLRRSKSAHKLRKDGRSEVRARVRKRTLLVIYKRLKGGFRVINAMQE